MIEIRETSILAEDANQLIRCLDRELSQEYAEHHRFIVDLAVFHEQGGVFVVGHLNQQPVACGGFLPLNGSDVELKRMFVLPDFRGQGISRAILSQLEEIAAEQGFDRVLLETGDQQFAAMRLYESAGYLRIPAFGAYANSPRSVCFAKELGGG